MLNTKAMKNRNLLFVTIMVLFGAVGANAQEGFGTNSPAPSSVIDMTATNKGALLPRVALTSTIVAAPVTAPADALTVFNTATTGVAPNNVIPGYYYWSTADSKWFRLLNQNDAVNLEPWQVQAGTAKASSNAQSIYQTGNVAVGDFSGVASTKKMEVKGTFKSEVVEGAISYGTEMNHSVLPAQSILNYRIDNTTGAYKMMAVHPFASVMQAKTSTTESTVAVNDVHSEMSSRLVSGATETAKSTVRTESPGNFFMETYSAANDYGSTISLQNDGLRLVHSTTDAPTTFLSENSRSEIMVQKGEGVRFDFKDAVGVSKGQYWFPVTSGTAGQVMTQSVGNKMVWTTPSSFALANNGLTKNATTNEIELGGTLNRTTVITTRNGATDYPFRFSGNGNTVAVSNTGTEGRLTANGTSRGSLGVTGGGATMNMFADDNAVAQITTSGNATGLFLTTANATSPLRLGTDGLEKMRITGTGNIGIGTNTPTEKLDHNGIARLRDLPLNGATNAINTTSGGSASASQDQTFTATRTVVSDANGVLGYVSGVPTQAGSSRVIVSAGVPGTQDIGNTNMALAVYSNEYIDVHSAWNNNVFTVPANMGGLYIFSMQSSHSHDANAQPSWFTMSLLQKSTDGGNSWSLLLRDTRSGALGSDVDNGNSLYWTGTLNAGDRLRLLYHCNSTASNYVRLGSLTITKLAQ